MMNPTATSKLSRLDAFYKVDDAFLNRTNGGGWTTLCVVGFVVLWTLAEFSQYLTFIYEYQYVVDPITRGTINVNLDLTVNTPCSFLSLDFFDAAGNLVHIGNVVEKEDTQFTTAGTWEHGDRTSEVSLGDSLDNILGGIYKLAKYGHGDESKGTACRFVGEFDVNKVSGNLHITPVGHIYGGMHTPHELMNFTHRIDRFTFGTKFPNPSIAMSNPLSRSFEVLKDNFVTYHYYITVVPTKYVSNGNSLWTNQYAVTDHSKVLDPSTAGAVGITSLPGLFFHYKFEPIAVEIYEQRKESFLRFFVRLCGIIGGVYVCAGHGFYIFQWVSQIVKDGRRRTVRI